MKELLLYVSQKNYSNERILKSDFIAINKEIEEEIIIKIQDKINQYRFDHYKYYPATDKEKWKQYYFLRLKKIFKNNEWFFIYDFNYDYPFLVGCRISKWDEEHFGFKMAFIDILFCIDIDNATIILKRMIHTCLNILYQKGIKFVSARCNGDNIPAIHALEDNKFRYYETIIWPVVSCLNINIEKPTNVRLMGNSDLEQVLKIARKNPFQRGHYHCDKNFNIKKVDSMYKKWTKTAWENNDPITIIEDNGQVCGFFVFKMDNVLSRSLGYKYARMRSLALDKKFRGRGFGSQLWNGTIKIMKELGAEYIDSGYSCKNHISAKLHTKSNFYSVYDEVTMHRWL